MKKKLITTLLFMTALVLALLTYGCDSQGPAEKAGEKIDTAVEETKDAADDAADKITGQGPAEEAGEKIDENAEQMKESMQPKN